MSDRARALRLLHPKWLPLHLFTIAVCIAMVLLGRWQWHVAHQHHGDIRYYAYAFQWWAFTLFALVMWTRIMLDYVRNPQRTATPQQADGGQSTAAPTGRVATEPAEQYLAYLPPAQQGGDTDPERVRFNAYLARLNAEDAAKGGT